MKDEIKSTNMRTSKTKSLTLSLAVIALAGATLPALMLPAGAQKTVPAKTGTAISDLLWNTDLNAALTQAKVKKKYVLADVYTDWCLWCKRLDKDTFNNPQMMSYLAKKFLCVKVNAESTKNGRDVADKYKVGGFPCVLVFDPTGKFIGKIPKYYGPDEYQQVLEDLIKNPPSDPYAE